MKRRIAVSLLCWMAAMAAAPARAAEGGMADQLRSQWESARDQFANIAEAMPADKLGYKPTPEVRSFGEIVVHVAAENLAWMESVGGMAQPGAIDRFDNRKTRTEVLKAVQKYVAYGDKVMADMTDQKAMEMIPFGRRNEPTPRWVIVMRVIGHGKEHYGNLVTYLRLNNIVPPSTAARQP